MKSQAQKVLSTHGIRLNHDQFNLLTKLSESPALSQVDLAKKTLRDPASITRSLDLLETKRFLKRKTIEGNRRQYEVALTKKGKAYLEKYAHVIEDFQKQKGSRFSKKEMGLLIEMLKRLSREQ